MPRTPYRSIGYWAKGTNPGRYAGMTTIPDFGPRHSGHRTYPNALLNNIAKKAGFHQGCTARGKHIISAFLDVGVEHAIAQIRTFPSAGSDKFGARAHVLHFEDNYATESARSIPAHSKNIRDISHRNRVNRASGDAPPAARMKLGGSVAPLMKKFVMAHKHVAGARMDSRKVDDPVFARGVADFFRTRYVQPMLPIEWIAHPHSDARRTGASGVSALSNLDKWAFGAGLTTAQQDQIMTAVASNRPLFKELAKSLTTRTAARLAGKSAGFKHSVENIIRGFVAK